MYKSFNSRCAIILRVIYLYECDEIKWQRQWCWWYDREKQKEIFCRYNIHETFTRNCYLQDFQCEPQFHSNKWGWRAEPNSTEIRNRHRYRLGSIRDCVGLTSKRTIVHEIMVIVVVDTHTNIVSTAMQKRESERAKIVFTKLMNRKKWHLDPKLYDS